MSMLGPWAKQKSRRYRNGPLVTPGKYKVSISVPGTYVVSEFEIEADPRVLESGVTEADIQAQVDIQIKVRDKLSEALQLQDQLEQQLKAQKKSVKGSDSDTAKIAKLEAVLDKLKTKEGIYEQPMLADQWRYLYSMVNQADQVPGKDAYDRYEELSLQLEDLKKQVQ